MEQFRYNVFSSDRIASMILAFVLLVFVSASCLEQIIDTSNDLTVELSEETPEGESEKEENGRKNNEKEKDEQLDTITQYFMVNAKSQNQFFYSNCHRQAIILDTSTPPPRC